VSEAEEKNKALTRWWRKEVWVKGNVAATKREMFGFPRLRRLVAEHDADAEERSLVDFLMDELRSFTGEGWDQEDDITLVTLRRAAASR
jgi:hypothetical protein